ncbi:hypothetical protein EDF21_2549 [Frigoribacterium sp. PhB118]|nr:hypothetical protein EDF21_2549 [Frigoribacterium sp. PhB118]
MRRDRDHRQPDGLAAVRATSAAPTAAAPPAAAPTAVA